MHDQLRAFSTQINRVIREQFGLDPVNQVISFEFIPRANNPDGYDRVRKIHEDALAGRADSSDLTRRTYFGDEFCLHIECVYERSEVQELPSELSFYYPICSIGEILRISKPVDGWDALLALRADEIADSARLTRVFLRRRETAGSEWNLTSHFDQGPFNKYVALLSEQHREACESVAAGMAFLREPNGACIRYPLGDVLVVSESLEWFLYYMNLFLAFRDEIPQRDLLSSLVLAVRTMLLTEAPDFDLDPRGLPPPEIDARCRRMVEDQILFVVGHEYAHLLLNHLGDANAVNLSLEILPVNCVPGGTRYYRPRQMQEFEADAGSILHVEGSALLISDMLNAATWFFLGLDVLYAVCDYINPRTGAQNSHPDPVDRIWALRRAVLEHRNVPDELLYSDMEVEEMISHIQYVKGWLINEFVPFNVDALEMYGSVYLPSFRRTELIDRIDF